MKKLFLSLMLSAMAILVYAQDYSIKGRVLSQTKTTVEYANVVLFASDSIFVTGGISDQRGRFQMDNVKTGKYNLQISAIGYETKNIELSALAGDTDLGNIVVDSASIMLDEVTVKASRVINRPDRKIVLPTSMQVNASYNGVSLLQQLNLSRIFIDPIQKKISASGGDVVQLRINGIEVSMDEVAALRPEDILRVEHHDDPGLRYNGADAVIDIITRRKDSGGYIGIDTQNSPHEWWGDNFLTAKLNHKKSEFSTLYSGGYRGFANMWRENTETFHFEDGTSLTRVEDGTPDKWARNWNFFRLNYNYQEPEKYFFNAVFRTNWITIPRTYYNSLLYPVGKPEEGVRMKDRSRSEELRPSLDLYYQRSLAKEQTLILNVVGTYFNTSSHRTYEEKKDGQVITDILSKVDGDKYSLIGEGIYEKGLKSGKWSVGVKHTQSFSDNKYTGSNTARAKMNQSDTYAYTEIQRKVKKFNYSIGLGGTRAWFKQGGEGYTQFTFRPRLRLTYNMSDQSFLRYGADISSLSPSLYDLSDTEQEIDNLQIRRGNPNLKPLKIYHNALTYNARKGIFSANVYVGYWYHDKPIMEQTLRENGKFIRTVANQKSWQKLNPELEVKLGPIKDILTLSVTTGIQYFDSKGHTYRHTHTNWYINGQAMANYKKFTAMFMFQNHRNNLYGERLYHNENFHIFSLNYKFNNLALGVFTLNPFVDNWKSGDENWNSYASSKNWHYIKESSRLFAVSVAYNFSFGRKYQAASKRLNNEDNESGVMSGGK